MKLSLNAHNIATHYGVSARKFSHIITFTVLLFVLIIGNVAAQDAIAITDVNPDEVMNNQQQSVDVTGSNFTPDSTVRLIENNQALDAIFNDSTRLTVVIPPGIAVGAYGVEVNDPTNGTAMLASALVVKQEPTPIPPISVTRTEPGQVTVGQEATLSVFGQNFSPDTTVRLIGFGLLDETFVNGGALTAKLPSTIPTGNYEIEVSDPVHGTMKSPNKLKVNPPVAPPATNEPPVIPTPLPGQPYLVVSTFSASPATVSPGGQTTLTFVIVNQGNRTAEGVQVSLDAGNKFVPAGGQASITLPNIPFGSVFTATMTVTAMLDVTPGPLNVPVTMSYRDFAGQSYTSKADLSVTIGDTATASQVSIQSYAVNPLKVEPGQPVLLAMILTNTGNRTASQLLVRVRGSDSVLLPGYQGDTFAVGDLQPDGRANVQIPLIVRGDAKAGPQPQSITLTYIQDGQAKEEIATITIEVANVTKPEAKLLLAEYDTGVDQLKPGDRFTLKMTLQNIGPADATNLLVTFGTVSSTGDNDSGTTTSGTTGGSSTTPSTTFAPLNTGGRIYVGTVIANGTSSVIEQEFIVSGSVNSGIYSLPITLNYDKATTETIQESLSASLIVVVPPRLQIDNQSPLPETVNAFEPIPIMLGITNLGTKSVNFTSASISIENGEVLDGSDIRMTTLAKEEDISISGTIMAQDEGPITVTVTIHYLNDLNQDETIVNVYEAQAIIPPPMPEETFVPEPPIATPEPETDTGGDVFQRLIFGLLGLGS